MSEDATDATIETTLQAKLMQGVGICLFQYQQIEAHLKLLLPHMHHPDSLQHEDSRELHWQGLLDSKKTLGPLMEDFKLRSSSVDPDSLGRFLKQIVEERNDLVHHLLNDPTRPLRTNADAQRTIEVLRQYSQSAATLLRALCAATAQFVQLLDNSPRRHRFLATLEFPLGFDHVS